MKDKKNFTFREIAEWLTKRGIHCDHNAVYRQYTTYMDDHECEQVAEEDQVEEKEQHEIEEERIVQNEIQRSKNRTK